MDKKYLELLSNQYPNINSACTEIINLKAILSLPKGTEHFLSDIHGEYEAFNHVLRNASGVIKNYIEEIFGSTLMEGDKKNLATLIYYPELRLDVVKNMDINMDDWYKINLFRLIQVCKRVASKYTRSKVRKALPKEFAYILEELIHEDSARRYKYDYYNEIINTIVKLNRADNFIVAICNVIHVLAIDHLHVIGDIYDRGEAAEKIMDVLMNYHSVDVQWGNHDISWLGAASGSEACICNVIRVSCKYFNLNTIEESYGINLIPLATFAMETYKNDKCLRFRPSRIDENVNGREIDMVTKMHKAITVMQFKIEAQTILRNPEFELNDRIFIDKMDLNKKTVLIEGKEYPLTDDNFPTIDPKKPFELSPEENEVMEKIRQSFIKNPKLHQHARFLFNKGSMYTVYNDNLLLHGCVPFNSDATFKEVKVNGKMYKGKELFDALEAIARNGFYAKCNTPERILGQDYMWYLWCGPNSPLYGKEKMTTFERYFTNEKKLAVEEKNPYYALTNSEEICTKILNEFGLSKSNSHIVNGHVPVKVSKGESPIKAGGKLLIIDGGFAKAYQSVTGIAGYTLIYNSRGLVLASHEPFSSTEEAVKQEKDIISSTQFLEHNFGRKMVESTDIGRALKTKIQELEELVEAYGRGEIKENKKRL